MNTNLQAELVAHLTEWLQERGVLQNNQTVEVSLKFLSAAPVALVVVGADVSEEVEFKKFIAQKIPFRSRTRWSNVFFNVEIKTFTQLNNVEADRLWRFRNIGKNALRDLLVALKQNGMSDYSLTIDLERRFGHEHLKVSEEAERSVVKKLTEQDWTKMLQSLMTPARSHIELELKVMALLQGNKNAPLQASKAFPKGVPAFNRRSRVTEMNHRWRNQGLPYRMRFVSKLLSSPDEKFDGEIQIGLYQTQEQLQVS